EDDIAPTESAEDAIVEVTDIVEASEDEPVTVPYEFLGNVPVFPGCEHLGSNQERKACMSKKITQFVNSHFDTGLGNELGLEGVNRVNVMFKIDTNGNVVDVQARAPHPRLEEEAKQIIKQLPHMQPGKQRGKPVIVSYALPIIFQVQ
ncbi:MAG: energy transducer TonB, partial [Salegentibacter sp.]